MATVHLDQHLCAVVPRGIDRAKGAGFQTFACSERVATSLEFRELEQLVHYQPVVKAGATAPLRETFVKLASGRYAVGRTGYVGTGPDGQPNHLTRHLIFEAEVLDHLNGDPFVLFEEMPPPHAAQIKDPYKMDALDIKVTPTPLPFEALTDLPEQVCNDLAVAITEGSKKPILLVAGAKQRTVLRAARGLVAPDDRLALTFDTLYDEANPQRSRYHILGLPSHAGVPRKLSDYTVFELEPDPTRPPLEAPPRVPTTAYSQFVLRCLGAGSFPLLNRYHMLLTSTRRGLDMPLGHGDAELLDVLFTQEPDGVTRSLAGHADTINSVLPHLASREAIGVSLANTCPPTQLVGQADSRTICGCLAAMRDCVPAKTWAAWGERHVNDPLWRKDAQIAALRPKASFWSKLKGG